MEERLGYLKTNNMNKYTEMIDQAGNEFKEMNFEVTKAACEFIDLDEEHYQASVEEAEQD